MEFILFSIILILLLISFNQWRFLKFRQILPYKLQLIFLLKIGVVFFGVFFFSKYKGYGESSDIFSFFKAAIEISKNTPILDQIKTIFHLTPSRSTIYFLDHLTYWKKDFDYGLPNDNQTMIKFSLILSIIGMNFYSVHALISTYLGFLGILIIFKTIYISSKNTLLNLLFISLTPTLLFFSSGIYKECLLLFYFGILLRIIVSKNWIIPLILFLTFYSLFPIKPYFFLIISPSIIVYLFTKNYHPKKTLLVQCFVYLGLFFSLIMYSKFQETKFSKDDVKYGNVFDPIKMMTYKQDDFLDDGFEKKSKITKTLTVLETKSTNIYKAIPYGMYCGWFHPSILNCTQKSFIPFAIEYTIIIFLMSIFVIQTFQKKIFFTSETTLILIICIVYSTFIGITSPIIGNLIRFKTPIMPFIYYLFSLIQLKRTVKW